MMHSGRIGYVEQKEDTNGPYLETLFVLAGSDREVTVFTSTDHPALAQARKGQTLPVFVIDYDDGETQAYLPENALDVKQAMRPQSADAPAHPEDDQHRQTITATELHGIVEHVIGTDLLAMVEQVRLATERCSKTRALADHLERQRRGVRARASEVIREKARTDGEKMSEARLASLAQMSDPYEQHLLKQFHADEQLATAEAEMYELRNRHEALLRMLAYARTEMEMTTA